MIPIRDDQPRFSTPYVTYFIVALNVLIFLFELSVRAEGPHALAGFMYQFGVVPREVTGIITGTPHISLAAAFVPILTSMFLHASFLHILGRLVVVLRFGRTWEGLSRESR